MKRQAWLRLSGTRYRCVPLYAQIDEFDPLARLFIDVLKEERSLPRLVRAFGLTERVVEDVLGDLIRRTRAVLRIQNGVKEIQLLDGALPSVVHERAETLEIWQDKATGLVLPAWIADRYDRPSIEDQSDKDRIHVLPDGQSLIDPFTEASDAQLIDVLIRADEELRQREETLGILDRVTDRYRVRPQTIGLPVIEADIQGRSLPLLTSEHVPGWIARVWSVALRQGSSTSLDEEVDVHVAATTDDEGYRVVHGWRMSNRLEAWRSAVDRVLRLVPPPVSGYDLRQVREFQAGLSGVLLSIGRIELMDDRVDWHVPAFDSSKNWVVLVLPTQAHADRIAEWIKNGISPDANLPSTLLLLSPPNVTAAAIRDSFCRLAGPEHFAECVIRSWPRNGPAVAIGDSSPVRIRYSSQSPVLQCAGDTLTTEWLGLLQALPAPHRLPSPEPDSDPLRRLRVRRSNAIIEERVTLGVGPEARSIADVVDDLRGLEESLLTAIVDPELLVQGQAEPGNDERTSSGISFDKQRPLIQQLPGLVEKGDEIAHHLSLSPAPPWTVWTRLAAHELMPTLIALLTEPSRRAVAGEILILASATSDTVQSAHVAALVEKAVGQLGWTLQVAVAKEPGRSIGDITKALSGLRGRVGSSRLRLWCIDTLPPMPAVIIDDLVFVVGGDWLRSVLRQDEGTDFGFAIESQDLAERLRAYLVDAQEIRP